MKIGINIKSLPVSERFKMLKWFCTEVDYAANYSDEERVELFNQFQIPNTQRYFCPLYSLFKFCRISSRSEGQYSHSGAVLSNLTLAEFDCEKRESAIGGVLVTHRKEFYSEKITIKECDSPYLIAETGHNDTSFEYKISKYHDSIQIKSKNLSVLNLIKYLNHFGLIDESDFKTAKMF